MSIATERRLRNGERRTLLSGTWVPPTHEPLPTWFEIVEPGPKPKARVEAESTAEIRHPFSGLNRAGRRQRLRGLGPVLGSYTEHLHRRLGEAWQSNIEARRSMRRNARTARILAQRAEAA